MNFLANAKVYKIDGNVENIIISTIANTREQAKYNLAHHDYSQQFPETTVLVDYRSVKKEMHPIKGGAKC